MSWSQCCFFTTTIATTNSANQNHFLMLPEIGLVTTNREDILTEEKGWGQGSGKRGKY